MECPAYGQAQGAACSGGLGLLAGSLYGLYGSRNDQLARAVVVGGYDDSVDRCANLFDHAVLQAENSGHRARLGLAGCLHGHCTLRNELQTVLERKGSGNDKRREFAERVSGCCVGLYAQRLGHDDRVEEYGRLGDFGLLELLVRTGEHDVGDTEAEDFIGFLKEFLCCGNVVVEVFTHSDSLGTLAREYVCVLHNFHELYVCGGKDIN